MILAFGNKAEHGKDTAGEAVANFYNTRRDTALQHFTNPTVRTFPPARVFKFAAALYKVCREEYGMTEKDAPLLQGVGDGRREKFGLNYWIDQLAPEIKAFEGIAVITDMRYTNEADWVKSLGGWTIQVNRLNQDGSPFVTKTRNPDFISEVQLDNYNYDAKIVSKCPALTAELAITHAEYFRGLNG